MTSDGWHIRALHHVAIAHGKDPVCEESFIDLLGVPVHAEGGPGFLERMYPVGDAFVQTLEANGDGVVQRFLESRGPGLHHIAFAVDSLDAALEDLQTRSVPLIDREARPGGMGTRIAFLHPSATGGVLVELVEEGARPDGHGGRSADG